MPSNRTQSLLIDNLIIGLKMSSRQLRQTAVNTEEYAVLLSTDSATKVPSRKIVAA
jgi:hypothetical protein